MKTIRILAGMMMYELVDFMVENGVQIPALPTIINTQIAGTVSTGSHVSFSNMHSTNWSFKKSLKILNGENGVYLLW